MERTNIALIGLSGCGKTTVGQELSKIRSLDFMDTDYEVAQTAKIPITEIFERFGEQHFRALESEAVKNASSRSNTVIATGGGCVKNSENMENLARRGIIVYLKCSAEKVYENIKSDTSRPLLLADDKLKKIEELYTERRPLYEKYAGVTVDITNLGIKDVALEIIARIQSLPHDGHKADEYKTEEYAQIEGKLLLLYLIDKMDIPLSNSQISQFALQEDYMDYFILQQNLTEMTKSGFLDKFQDNNNTRYTILDKGLEILDFFENRIPFEIRSKINKYVIDNRKTIKKDYEITANYFHDHTNNEFIVKCGVYEDEIMLMELNVSVVSKEQAKTMCANWKNNVKTVYAGILESLLAKPDGKA